jgi:hypothetical protein
MDRVTVRWVKSSLYQIQASQGRCAVVTSVTLTVKSSLYQIQASQAIVIMVGSCDVVSCAVVTGVTLTYTSRAGYP